MLAQIRLFPESASSYAPDVDYLFFFQMAVTVFFVGLIATFIFVFAVRYRRSQRPEYPEQVVISGALEAIWIGVPLVLLLIMFTWGAVVYFNQSVPPADSMEIYIVGKQWMWKAQHPSGRREINELHIPVNRPVKLTMISQDVIHSFFIPAFRAKQDVLPGRFTHMWFEATQPGVYHLFCTEYCGTNHSKMVGQVVAMEENDFQQWLEDQDETMPLEVEGRQLYVKFRCYSCHEEPDSRRGPLLVGRFGQQVQTADGSRVLFDEQYVFHSIRYPQRAITAGYEPIMPAYSEEQLGAPQITAIIEYLKSRQQ